MRDMHDLITAAQAGSLASTLAARFGVTPAQAQAVLAAALPHIADALSHSDALPTVVKSALQGVHQQSFQAPGTAVSPPATSAGSQVLGDLLRRSGALNELAATIAARTGVPADQVSAMLPAIASVLLGGIWHVMEQKGFAGALQQIGAALTHGSGPASGQAGGGLEGMVGGILSQVLHGGAAPAGSGQGGLATALEALRGMLSGARSA